MYSHLNYKASKSGRLIIAVLFSLALHILLLFFIKFAPPSWKISVNLTIPLNVILEKRAVRVPKPAGIPEASLYSKGNATTGIQETNSFPQETVTAITHAQVDQPKIEIPRQFINKKILTLNKPAKTTIVESDPVLLVAESVPFEIPKNEGKPLAPTPSVENPVVTFAPPIEKLVSPKPIPGVGQEKIVIAEPARKNLDIEEPENSIEDSAPVKIEELTPIKVAEPEPVKIEKLKPVEAEVPKPAKIEEQKPIKAEEPRPIKAIEEAKPVKAEEPAPIKAEEQSSAKTEVLAESKSQPSEAGEPDVLRAKPPGYTMPSLAELSMAAARNFSRGENKRIQFGDRRKSVDFKERDFRYLTYVEGVRLKLERIGSFNYPAAAAKNNQSGTLSVMISIRSDGSLENFSIVRPSVNEALNAGAERIVRMSAPFSPLPDNIKKDVDILSITINWNFSNLRQSLD